MDIASDELVPALLAPGLNSDAALDADASQGHILELRDYGIAFRETIVLAGISLRVPARGMLVLLGPGGAGKSTLLRTLAGFNDAHPALRTWGTALYAGRPLSEECRPALVAQKARLLMASVHENLVGEIPERHTLTRVQQRDLAIRLLKRSALGALADRLDDSVSDLSLGTQRRLAIARTAASSPWLLCVDEPTAELSEEDAQLIIELLRCEARRRAVLVVTHNQIHAHHLGGHAVLLAGGRIQESGLTQQLLDAPRTQAGRDFRRTGSCDVPSPNARPEDLAPDASVPPPPPPEARVVRSESFGPRGFRWLRRGVLGGTPRPGVVADLKYDLEALRRVGVTVLIAMSDKSVAPDVLAPYGIRVIAAPVPDMGAPTPAAAAALCRQVAELIQSGEVVAVHCEAGLGRTGTQLAAQLIWEGWTPLGALEEVRRIEPRWVQSETQVEFLRAFGDAVAHRGRDSAAPDSAKLQ